MEILNSNFLGIVGLQTHILSRGMISKTIR